MRNGLKNIDDVLLSPEYVDNPYPTYDLLRSEYPVYWCEKWNGWLITRYDDVQSVLKDTVTFSNRGVTLDSSPRFHPIRGPS